MGFSLKTGYPHDYGNPMYLMRKTKFRPYISESNIDPFPNLSGLFCHRCPVVFFIPIEPQAMLNTHLETRFSIGSSHESGCIIGRIHIWLHYIKPEQCQARLMANARKCGVTSSNSDFIGYHKVTPPHPKAWALSIRD